MACLRRGGVDRRTADPTAFGNAAEPRQPPSTHSGCRVLTGRVPAGESPPLPPGETAPSSPGRLVCVTEVARTKAELATALASLEGTSALVMTMGALHGGHLALVRAARETADNVVVSIFVNPLQFGPDEDYEAYPRDLAADLARLGTVGGGAVYAPEAAGVYPRQPPVRIDPGPVAALLEGKTRPTHFAGVLQVVHKVLNLVRPDMAFFGQKDAQQLALVRTMVADLDMPVEIRAVPIERDVDGLALSSRNSYLSATQRIEALALSQALVLGKDSAAHGLSAAGVREVALRYLAEAPGVRLDYLALVDPQTFQEIGPDEGAAPAVRSALLAVAAWVGPTRLIDNMEIELHG